MEIINYHLTSFGTSLSGTDSIIAGSFEDIFYCFFLPFLICFFTGGSSTATKISTQCNIVSCIQYPLPPARALIVYTKRKHYFSGSVAVYMQSWYIYVHKTLEGKGVAHRLSLQTKARGFVKLGSLLKCLLNLKSQKFTQFQVGVQF